ncbi:Leucine-rich repeat-containing protein [Artemisia annua]|uniref:Leucine-rich repeat-containing protein n=1 Tax=Artemisia annua TaxID=35608 RepID=A0A2U1MU31_ARTAN|nr:Leucine-rich repeat-containing protein [Artemisia annua]
MFSGNVPFESFTSPSLKELFLDHNQLGGQIDVQTFPQLTNLTTLWLSDNNFSGELELDTLLSTLTNLESLYLSYSGFSVTTNNANHYIKPGFISLGLASCKLKVFPNSLRAMKQLSWLDLSQNEIHGQIPHWAGEIGGTYGLGYLNLSHNFITALPQFQWYGLEDLSLQSNLIEGPFPPSICNMSNLVSLDMSHNSFGGLIPKCFGNISSSLRMIDMGNNSFQGTIPNVYGGCRYLEGLILKGNKLEGEVPSSLSKCLSLKVVDFGNNHLNGTFPGWLGALPNLQALVLKSNNFHGHIQPLATVDSPFPSLRVLDLSHNGTFASSLNNNHTRCPKQQSEALLLFKHSLSSINYPNDDCGSYNHPKMMSWNTSTDCCKWDGVKCDNSTGDVIELHLMCGMLQGTIHPLSSLFNLTHLTFLDLSNNKLNGTLPSWLFTSTSLEYLLLMGNMFSGNVPFESFASPSLQMLFLDNNHGELELDTLLSTLTNLEWLDLSYSGFSVSTNNASHYVNPGFRILGLASCKLKVFPNSVRAMKQLVELDLSSNEIHGQIPHWAGEIGGNELYRLNLSHNFITSLPQFQWHGLGVLYLQSNLIEGPFPPSICKMSNLTFLDMSNNSFGGLIPQCFGNISSYVRMIDMGNNSFQGTIPNVYSDCGNLEGLILKGNQLRGEVPNSLSKCQSLKVVDFGNNHLNGTFPSWLRDLPNLQVLVLKSNNFHGHIQPSATVDSPFPSLLVLDLSHNGFEVLPATIDITSSLKLLNLGYTEMKGILPHYIFNLHYVETLDLRCNSFTGDSPSEISGNLTLPSWLFTSPSLEYLNLTDNMLSGDVPFESFAFPSLKTLDLSSNQLVGHIDVQTFRQLTNLINNFSVTTKNAYHCVNPGFRTLRLASCKLKVFPNSFRGMKQLEWLDLSNNEIHGQIPHWAGETGSNELVVLDLSYNFIKGPFPPSICNMGNLKYLDMSHNSFDGVIPKCLGNITSSLVMMDLGINLFQGTIPNVFKDCRQLEGLILNGNQLEGKVPSSLSKCQRLRVLDFGNNHLNVSIHMNHNLKVKKDWMRKVGLRGKW